MTARIQRYGRAAKIRDVLFEFPKGATTAEIKAAGVLSDKLNAIGTSLIAMRKSDQVTMSMGLNSIVWSLTPKTRAEMARMAATAAVFNRPRRALPAASARPSDSSTTIRHKDDARAAIADQLDAFRRAGGKVEVLGNTPFKSVMNRRQGNDSRMAKSAKV